MHSTAFVPPVYEINMKTLPLWPLDAKKKKTTVYSTITYKSSKSICFVNRRKIIVMLKFTHQTLLMLQGPVALCVGVT